MGGARLVARVPHTHLVPKIHGMVRVLRCDVRHNILQERGLLRFGEETEWHRPPSANLITATQSFSTCEREHADNHEGQCGHRALVIHTVVLP